MAKIPDAADVFGLRTVPKSSRGVQGYRAGQEAEAAYRAGGRLVEAGEDIDAKFEARKKEMKKLELARAQSYVLQQTTQLEDSLRNDQDYTTHEARWVAGMNDITAKASSLVSEDQRELFSLAVGDIGVKGLSNVKKNVFDKQSEHIRAELYNNDERVAKGIGYDLLNGNRGRAAAWLSNQERAYKSAVRTGAMPEDVAAKSLIAAREASVIAALKGLPPAKRKEIIDESFGPPKNAPLSVRNNNPGNIRGKDGNFIKYTTKDEGMAAMRADLEIKISGSSKAMAAKFGEGYTPTLRTLIGTWAPTSENDTESYINTVSADTGIDPDALLTTADIDKIMPSMIKVEGGAEASTNFSGSTNPILSHLSEDTILALRDITDKEIIAEQTKLSASTERSWNEFQAAQELLIASGQPVDLGVEFEKWKADNSGGYLDADTASKINVKFMNLQEKQVKENKDLTAAYPFISGKKKFSGSDDDKKAIEKGYTWLLNQEAPYTERALWLAQTGITAAPSEFINETQTRFQSAILKQDTAAMAEVAEGFDIVQSNAPILANQVDDKIEAAIIYTRDMMRMGAVGPQTFVDIQEIMSQDPSLTETRKKELKTLQTPDFYRSAAAKAVDEGFFSLQPSKRSAVVSQIANDYKKIYEVKYLASGNADLAKKATEPLMKKMYGPSSMAVDGYMRMPPERYYAQPNDSLDAQFKLASGGKDYNWMKDDLIAAVTYKPGLSAPDTNIEEQVRILADPRAKSDTASPEYLVTLSKDSSSVFDTMGIVWKPDVRARQEFLAQYAAGTLDKKYYTDTTVKIDIDASLVDADIRTSMVESKRPARIPDYRSFMIDWYRKQEQNAN